MTKKRPAVSLLLGCWLILAAASTAPAQNGRPSSPGMPPDFHSEPRLAELVNNAVRAALARFAGRNVREQNLSITLIDLGDPRRPAYAGFRGAEAAYPASVVKLFYLVMAHQLLETGKLKETAELKRALKDMIVDSSNDATGYVLDAITGTSSGVELSGNELRKWSEKRNVVNRYFAARGYAGINVNQKTFCEAPYGREQVFRGPHGENRNRLTTDATARLLSEIATGRAVNPARSRMMMELLKRDFSGKSTDPDDQSHGFTALALGPGARLWSKAGWTSSVRHDAAYIELPNGARFVLVTFTTDHSAEHDLIPTVARLIIEELGKQR
ncbi:MAG TPA: serine hydrolase [Pyrinomonadaceae bacterium]